MNQRMLTQDELDQLYWTAIAYIVPIYWRSARKGMKAMVGGTGFFLDTGASQICVTAEHVYSQYIADQSDLEEVGLRYAMVGERQFRLDEHLIQRSDILDVATLNLTADEVSSRGLIKCSYAAELWPPAAPQNGETLLVVGYPGREREWDGKIDLTAGIGCVALEASSVSDRRIMCSFDFAQRVTRLGQGGNHAGDTLGGMSGAPAWRILTGPGGQLKISLAGVVVATTDSMMTITRLDPIQTDGRFLL